MAEARVPLLMKELQTHQRVMLGQIVNAPGFKVVDMLYEAVLVEAMKHMAKLDPEETDYDRKVAARAQRSRNFNECIKLIRDSIDYHVGVVKSTNEQENQQAVDAVAKTFGIHTVPPKVKVKK